MADDHFSQSLLTTARSSICHEIRHHDFPSPAHLPSRFGDARGWLTKTCNCDSFVAMGIDYTFVQDI
jgi:hypothetical protein